MLLFIACQYLYVSFLSSMQHATFKLMNVCMCFGFQEIDELCDEWVPEPLIPTITDEMKSEPPVLERWKYSLFFSFEKRSICILVRQVSILHICLIMPFTTVRFYSRLSDRNQPKNIGTNSNAMPLTLEATQRISFSYGLVILTGPKNYVRTSTRVFEEL